MVHFIFEACDLHRLVGIRQVWDSPAYPGVLHNAFIDAGIPSICPEVGAARILDPTLIAPFVEGTMNVLKHYGVIGGSIGRTAAESGAVTGNAIFPVLATVSRDTQFYELTRHPVLRGPCKRKLPPAGALTLRSQSAPAKGSGMPGVVVSF